MNKREKTLLILVCALVGVFALGFGVHFIVMKPAKDIDRQISGLRRDLAKLKTERLNYFADEDKVKGFAQRTFATELDRASARSGEMLTQSILQSGLKESEFTRLPVGPRKIRGANEIGWSVQGDGPLMRVVNLIYVLQESPQLHRVESLVILAGDTAGRVKVRFRYLTLVIDPAPEVTLTNLVARRTLDSEERRIYDSIVQRDLLRPYVKRPPPPPAPPATQPLPPPAPSVPPGPESMRVVSLSEWQGQPEVHVRDLVNERTICYQVGDALAGGTIVMIDYRALPMPGNALLQSFSRVIVQIGTEYWAIERGRTLMEKYKLTPEQLPETLSKL